ncbi:MAG: NUDIX hydrolase [Desulfobacterales bacterium]|jgi:8-oxo-dGTP pyrophosphatase MutT (NUDIX family)
MIPEWSILKRQQVADYNIFSLHKKQVRSPRTGEIREMLALQFPDWVITLALTRQQEVVMIRQYRHGTEQVCLELPGGLVDPDDTSPESSAQRELLEETGFTVSNIRLIGECYPQPAILSNRCFFYLAEDAVKTQQQELDAGEDIEILTVPLKDIRVKIQNKEIDHGMVLQAFFFLALIRGWEHIF